MSTGFTTVSASYLQDASGAPIPNATIQFTPSDNQGNPVSFRAGGAHGQVISQPVRAVVTNGAFSVNLADTSLTLPVNIGYRVAIIDNITGKQLLGSGYTCVQPTGNTWSFDDYQPNVPVQKLIQTGPPGPPMTFRGAFDAGVVYAKGDAVSYSDGSSYISLTDANTGSVPPTSTSAWGILARAPQLKWKQWTSGYNQNVFTFDSAPSSVVLAMVNGALQGPDLYSVVDGVFLTFTFSWSPGDRVSALFLQ